MSRRLVYIIPAFLILFAFGGATQAAVKSPRISNYGRDCMRKQALLVEAPGATRVKINNGTAELSISIDYGTKVWALFSRAAYKKAAAGKRITITAYRGNRSTTKTVLFRCYNPK